MQLQPAIPLSQGAREYQFLLARLVHILCIPPSRTAIARARDANGARQGSRRRGESDIREDEWCSEGKKQVSALRGAKPAFPRSHGRGETRHESGSLSPAAVMSIANCDNLRLLWSPHVVPYLPRQNHFSILK